MKRRRRGKRVAGEEGRMIRSREEEEGEEAKTEKHVASKITSDAPKWRCNIDDDDE